MLASPARTRAWLAALALSLCAPALAQTAAQTPAASPPNGEPVTKRLDPTDFKTRFETRYEYQSGQNGGHKSLLVPRYEYAFSKTVAARIDVPYVRDDRPGVPDEDGLGDIVVRVNYRALRGQGYTVVLAPELALDTASDDRLGTGKYVFQPAVFASIDMPNLKSVLFPFVQQLWSFAGDDDRSDINTTLLRASVLTRLPNRFYTLLEPSLYIDWEHGTRTGFTLELEVGRLLNPQLAIWVRPGVSLWGDNVPGIYDWNFEVGFRYFLD